MTENLFLTATEIAEHFGDGSLSPVELLDATVERAKSVQSRLNPFRIINAEQARKTARASERRWAEGNPLSRLDGVPVAIKDNQAIAGEPHTSGSRALEHLPPATEDAPHVARLREAGALFYARTTVLRASAILEAKMPVQHPDEALWLSTGKS